MSMDNKNKLLTWSVILLVIVNVIVITFLWSGHKRNERMQPPRPAEFLAKALNLNDSQKIQLHQLADRHHRESEKIREEIKDARDHYFDMLKQPGVADSTKSNAANNIALHLKELEILTFDHFQKVRAICSAKQQIKFDEMINEVIHMVGAPPPGHREGRGSGPPPPPPPE